MRYLALYRPESGIEGGTPEPEHMAAMGRLIEEMMKAGSLLGTEPLTPRAQCAQVRLSDGQFTVSEVDGRMGGFAFLQANSKEEAIELSKSFLKVAGDGVTEIRQILEFGPPPA